MNPPGYGHGRARFHLRRPSAPCLSTPVTKGITVYTTRSWAPVWKKRKPPKKPPGRGAERQRESGCQMSNVQCRMSTELVKRPDDPIGSVGNLVKFMRHSRPDIRHLTTER